jgi:hypothetical protein
MNFYEFVCRDKARNEKNITSNMVKLQILMHLSFYFV